MVKSTQYSNILMFLIIFLGLIFAPCAYGNGQNGQASKPIQIVRGHISGINWVGSRLTIRWLQPNGVTVYDDMTFSVPRDAKITRNGESITLSDVQIGDNTKVEYVDAGLAGLRALNISIVK